MKFCDRKGITIFKKHEREVSETLSSTISKLSSAALRAGSEPASAFRRCADHGGQRFQLLFCCYLVRWHARPSCCLAESEALGVVQFGNAAADSSHDSLPVPSGDYPLSYNWWDMSGAHVEPALTSVLRFMLGARNQVRVGRSLLIRMHPSWMRPQWTCVVPSSPPSATKPHGSSYRVVINLRPGRPENVRPKALTGRIISAFWDQRAYHFQPPYFPSENEMLAIFEPLVRPEMRAWCLFGRPYYLYPNSVGRQKMDTSLV